MVTKIIEHPFTIDFKIGGYFSDRYEVYNCGLELIVTYNEMTSNKLKTEAQWANLWVEIDDINVWRWEKSYFDPDTHDGIQWELLIDRIGKRRRRISGSNKFPDGMRKFLKLIEIFSDLEGKLEKYL
ncbi:hypothetical protein OA513_00370 [Alphaproteobacteria bacterium]|nr:hypothetical protein [Alphaproteobacteria bacterium]